MKRFKPIASGIFLSMLMLVTAHIIVNRHSRKISTPIVRITASTNAAETSTVESTVESASVEQSMENFVEENKQLITYLNNNYVSMRIWEKEPDRRYIDNAVQANSKTDNLTPIVAGTGTLNLDDASDYVLKAYNFTLGRENDLVFSVKNDGDLDVAGSADFEGLVSIKDNLEVKGEILPKKDLTYNLGSPDYRWKNLYFTGSLVAGDLSYSWPDTQGTNGQVLTNDGSGNLTWEDVGSVGLNADTLDSLDSTAFLRANTSDTFEAGNTLTVAGTANVTGALQLNGTSISSTATELNYLDGTSVIEGGVIFSNGTYLTQDISNFYWNDSSNRLGIGTSNPTVALEVSGTIGTNDGNVGNPAYTFASDITTGTYLPTATSIGQAIGGSEVLRVSAGGNLALAGDTDTYWGRPAANTLNWVTGGTERMRITNQGILGVGTTTPSTSYRVDVNGGIRGTDIRSTGDITGSRLVVEEGSRIYEDVSFFRIESSSVDMLLTAALNSDIILSTWSGGNKIISRVGVTDIMTVTDSSPNVDIAGTMEFSITTTGDTTIGVCKDTADGTSINIELRECSSTPSDIAEFYAAEEGLKPGDVVEIDYQNNQPTLVKASNAYAGKAIGVVSTFGVGQFGKPLGESTIENKYNPTAIGLSGKVPVVVSNINGDIEVGDPITTSDIPGVAMKATSSGKILGYALEPYDGNVKISQGVRQQEDYRDNNLAKYNEDPVDPIETDQGKILLFINLSWYQAEVQTAISAQENINQTLAALFGNNIDTGEDIYLSENLSLDALVSDITTKKIQEIFENGNINMNGDVVINGTLTADKIKTREVEITQSEFIGTATIAEGENETKIEVTNIKEDSKVFITAKNNIGNNSLYIKEIKEGEYFIIGANEDANDDIKVDWWIIQVEKEE